MTNFSPRFGVVVFPGSNCDQDCRWAISDVGNWQCDMVWHEQEDLSGYDCIVLPGGFSYGDHLRTGAVARFSPVMRAVCDFAEQGGLVIGICNGFQILLEAGLLPGAMQKNDQLSFVCRYTYISVENYDTPFTGNCSDVPLKIPIAHYEGNYYADPATVEKLTVNRQVLFRYVDASGNASRDANPNGSVNNIAGIVNDKGNVLGMMPHPERACDAVLGSDDGLQIFSSIASWLQRGVADHG